MVAASAAPGKGAGDRCRQRKEETLATHRVEPVPRELDKALDEIVQSARRNLGQ